MHRYVKKHHLTVAGPAPRSSPGAGLAGCICTSPYADALVRVGQLHRAGMTVGEAHVDRPAVPFDQETPVINTPILRRRHAVESGGSLTGVGLVMLPPESKFFTSPSTQTESKKTGTSAELHTAVMFPPKYVLLGPFESQT